MTALGASSVAIALALTSCASDLSEPDGRDADGRGIAPEGVYFGESSDGTGGTSAATLPDGEVCAGRTAGAESLPAVLQLLVDTSGSMDQDAPGARGSKWTVTRRALLDAIDGMPGDASLGVIFYPNVPNDADPCFDNQTAVDLADLGAAGSVQRQSLARAFQSQRPQGGTPTHDAFRYAEGVLGASRAVGSRFLILITDGVPTYSLGCDGTGRQQDAVDPTPLIGAAEQAFAAGVRTFVIGSPGSEGARESLSRMAAAGGTSTASCSHAGPNYCHFDMTRESDLGAGLQRALEAIAGIALSCAYAVPPPPLGESLNLSQVNVLFTPPGEQTELLSQGLDASCADGWRYSDDFGQIRLCPSTCERVQRLDGTVSLQFGCTTRIR